jgi:23S rRNA (guanosine2251-2'-O)-methyltransferase
VFILIRCNFIVNLNCGKTIVQYLIYGKHSAIECLNNTKREILKIWCTKRFYLDYSALISKFVFDIISGDDLDSLVKGANHQGIVIETQDSGTLSTEEILHTSSRIGILDGITDPHNLGAIIRSAVAFGFDAVVTGKTNSAGESATVARVASGALEHINLLKVTNISRTMSNLKEKGFWIIGLDCNAAESIEHPLMNSAKIVIVLGSEGSGLRPLIRKGCDALVNIPMSKISSINVSNAASIAFYIASKKRT